MATWVEFVRELAPGTFDESTDAGAILDRLTQQYAQAYKVSYGQAFPEIQKACPTIAAQYAEQLRSRKR